VRTADNLATFMCRLSYNLGASTSWIPQGLSRSVLGLLYLYLTLAIELILGPLKYCSSWMQKQLSLKLKQPQ
jgi:hypothetical protein